MHSNRINNRRLKWCLSFVLLTGFLLSFYVHQTGLGLHQWIGVGCGVLALFHFLLHWKWVKAVAKSLFQHKRSPSKRYVIINAIIVAGFLIIGGTGLAMATWFDLELPGYTVWRVVHIAVAIITLLVVGLKIALHWRWIASTGKIIFGQPVEQPAPQVSLTKRSLSRREFLALIGLLGPVTILTFVITLDTLLIATELKREKIKLCYTYRKCGAKCHFPGNCYLYTDENNNKRCDWGECA